MRWVDKWIAKGTFYFRLAVASGLGALVYYLIQFVAETLRRSSRIEIVLSIAITVALATAWFAFTAHINRGGPKGDAPSLRAVAAYGVRAVLTLAAGLAPSTGHFLANGMGFAYFNEPAPPLSSVYLMWGEILWRSLTLDFPLLQFEWTSLEPTGMLGSLHVWFVKAVVIAVLLDIVTTRPTRD